MGSDLRRVYRTRLRDAFRLSQPLDASFPPRPCQSCFIPAALLGFALQRVSLPNRRRCLSTSPAPLDVVVDARARRPSEPAPFLRRRVVSITAPRSCVGATRESVVGFGRAYRGLSPFRKSVLRSAGVSRRWEPILSWVSALQGVPPHCFDTTAAVSPLVRFPDRVPKQAVVGAPGSSKHPESRDARPRDLKSKRFQDSEIGWSLSRLPPLVSFFVLVTVTVCRSR